MVHLKSVRLNLNNLDVNDWDSRSTYKPTQEAASDRAIHHMNFNNFAWGEQLFASKSSHLSLT
jgi:hypothetical protein